MMWRSRFESVFGANEDFSSETARDRFDRLNPADGLSSIDSIPGQPDRRAPPLEQLNQRLAREGAERGARSEGRAVQTARDTKAAFDRAFGSGGVNAGNSPAMDPGMDASVYDQSRVPADVQAGIDFENQFAEPGDTLKQRIGKSVAQNWAGFEQQAAGLVRFGAEHAGQAAVATAMQDPFSAATVGQVAKPYGDAAMKPVVQASEKVYNDAQADIEANQYHFNGKADYYGQNILDSLVQMVPTVATAMMTDGASLAAETEGTGGSLLARGAAKYGNALKQNFPGLAILAGQQGGQQYGQSRAAGRTVEESTMDAGVFALAESLPEAVELDILMKPGGRFLPRLLKSAGMEGVSEVVTQAVETGYQAGVLNEKMTWGQAFKSMLDAGIIGAGMGIGMGGASHGIHMARGGDKGAAIREMQDAQFDRSADEIATDSFSPNPGVRPVPRGIVEEAEAAAPPPTAQDHASPLPTDLIQRGKQRMAGAAASHQANSILQANGAPPVGTAVEIYSGGNMMKGTVADAFVADDPQLGKSPGIKIKLADGSIFEEHFADLNDAKVAIVPVGGASDAHPTKPAKPSSPEHAQPGMSREAAITFIMNRLEGGGQRVVDSGGVTRFGISQNAHPGVDVENMTEAQARDIYRREYWDKLGLDSSTDPNFALVAMDAAINQGPHAAANMVAAAGGDVGRLLDIRSKAYASLVASNPAKYGQYANGWENRLRTVAGTIGAVPSEGQTEAQPDTSWIDDIMSEDTSAADAQVQAISQGRDPLGLDQPNETISVRAGDILPFAVHNAGAGTEIDPARAAEIEQLKQSISAEGVREPLKLDIDQDRGTARLANGNHRAVIANGLNPDMMIPVEIRRLSGLKRELTSARPYSGEFDAPSTGDGTRAAPIDATTAAHVEAAGANVNTAPTDAQIEAGNYAKGHVRVHGLDITIENPKGSERSGTDPDGKPWSVTMPATYGYIKRTEGQDGEHVDVYVGEHPTAPHVFVVDQVDLATKATDEHKVMLGFDSQEAAISAYHDAFSDGKGVERIGAVTTMTVPQFKDWLKNGDTTKPAAEQVSDQGGQLPNETGRDAALRFVASKYHDGAADTSGYDNTGSFSFGQRLAGMQGAVRTPGKVNVELEGERGAFHTFTLDEVKAAAGVSNPVTPEPSESSGQFDPAPHIEKLRSYIREPGRSLNDLPKMARHLGLTEEQTHSVMGAIASRPGAGFRMTKGRDAVYRRVMVAAAVQKLGKNGRKLRTVKAATYKRVLVKPAVPPRYQRIATGGPTTVMALVRSLGGVRSDAHDLRNVGALARHPGVINNKTGMSLDNLGEALVEHGLFTERPDEDQVLQFLDRASISNERLLGEEKQDDQPDPRRDEAKAKLEAALKDPALRPFMPSIINTTDKAAIVDLMLSDDFATHDDPHAATVAHFASLAADTADELNAETGGHDYDIPFIEAENDAEPGSSEDAGGDHAEGRGRPAREAGDARQGEAAGAGAGEAGGQIDAFGERPEDKRVSLERKGEGRLQSDTQQKAPGSDGGLFDSRDTTGDLLAAKPAEPATPIGQARAALQTAMEALDAAESRKPEPGKMIEDAGEKIGGARKDQWAQRGMSVADLEGMTHGEAHQLVTKDAVWPKPDYAALVESGVPADVAAGIKLLRDSLTATPNEDSEQGRRDFIEQMAIARQVAESSRTMDDINRASSRLQKASPDMPDAMSMSYQWTDANKAARRRYFTIFRGRVARFRADPRKIREMVAQGFPAKAEPWTRRYDVRQSYGRGGAAGVWFVAPKGKRTIAADNFATKEEAEAAAKALYEGEDRTREKKPDRPHLDKIERTGADVRGGRDIDSADFLKDFGFRGVEFGNWVASDERQKATNLAYEALHDLADTLRIPPRALSLNDQLALAFGARGGGYGVAHYEPGKLVINLTKLSGAGSLAHEWGHALDHYFGTLDTDLGTRGAPKGASGWYDRTESRLAALGNLRPEMASAFDGLMKAIFKRDLTRAEMVRNAELRIEKLKAGIERQKAEVEKTKARLAEKGLDSAGRSFVNQSKAWIAQQESALLAAGRRLADLTDEKKPITASQVESSFYKEAQKLSGKSGSSGYWARPTEMLARSFESYVFDKIAARGEKSQYLVQGVEPDRYASETV
jgi:hypothetical protein